MATNPSRLKNTTITLVTLGVLALVTFGYFYFYIQQREENLQARHYRVLNQIRRNVIALNDTYIKNAGNNAAKDLQQLQNQAAVMYNEKIQLNNNRAILEIDFLANRYRGASTSVEDSLKAYLLDQLTFPLINSEEVALKSAAFEIDAGLIERKCENRSAAPPFQVNDSTRVFVRDCQSIILEQNGLENVIDFVNIPFNNLEITFEEFDAYYKQKINLNYKLREFKKKTADFQQSTLRPTLAGWELVFTDTINAGGGAGATTYEFELTRPFADLISKVMREDIFDEFVVYRVEKADSSDRRATYTSIFQTFEENFFSRQLAGEMDSLLIRQLDSDKRHTISGVPFRIYLQPLHLLRGEELFICGLVDQERFESEKSRIPPLIILFFGLAALLVLLALPGIKLLLLSKRESLNVSDLFLSLVSLVMGTSVVVLLFFNGYRVFLEDEKQRKKELEDLHGDISSSLFAELQAIYTQLTYYDSLKEASELPPEDPILRVLSDPADTLLYPRSYPYFNALLWATTDSRIGDEITPRENPTPKVDITGRQYLESFREGRAWDLPGASSGQQFMLESILTRTNGDQLAVVSTSSRTEAPIVFLSSYLHSVIHPVLPLGYGFCILNEEGKVLFHSDPSRNLQENFLEECSIKDLRSTMYSRAALHTEGSYLGLDHNFYLKPLDKLPLFLVTFENKRFYRMAHAQAVSLNILFAIGFLLFALLFLGLLHIFRPAGDTLKRTSYVLDWLRPTQINTNNYRRLFFINLLILLLVIFAARRADDLTAIMLILGSNFYAFVLAFFHLNRDPFKEFNWTKYWHVAVALGMIFLLFNGIALLVEGIDFQRVLAFEIIPLLIVIVILEAILSKPLGIPSVFKAIGKQVNSFLGNLIRVPNAALQKGWKGFLNNRRSYRFFLLSWLGISSILPAVKFYQISYDHERKLLTQLTHIQLDKDIQDRNLWIDQLYRGINTEESFLQRLKHKGIYTEPYIATRFNTPADREVLLEIVLLQPDSTFFKENIQQEIVLWSDSTKLFNLPSGFWSNQQINTDSLPGLPPLTLNTRSGNQIELRYTSHKMDDNYALQSIVDRNQLKDWLVAEKLKSLEDVQMELHGRNRQLSYQIIQEGADSALFSGMAQINITLNLLRPELEKKDEASRSLASTMAIFRPRFSETVRQTNQVNYDRSANELWYWIKEDNRLLYFNNQQRYSISSLLPKYAFPSLSQKDGLGLLFWVVFIAGIFVLYKVLNFHITRLFAQDVIKIGIAPAHSNKKLLLDTEENVFLVVPPAPINTDYLDVLQWKAAEFSSKPGTLQVIDMRQIPSNTPSEETKEKEFQIDPKSTLLALNHFDDQIENAEKYSARMAVLTQLRQQHPDKQLVLVSTRSQIPAPETKEEADTKTDNLPKKQPEQIWEEIMSHFVKIVYPVEQWTRLIKLEELLSFTHSNPSFLQIAPARLEEGVLINNHNLGTLDKQQSASGSFTYYTREIKTADTAISTHIYVLINGEDNAASLVKKIAFQKEQQRENKVVHILSTISPAELIKRCGQGRKTEAEDKARWIRLLAKMKKGLIQISETRPGPDEKIQNRILKETIGSSYLQQIQWELMSQFGDGHTSEALVVREIESRAQLYYRALWNSCSEQEKYIIYDVAKDGIVNSKNRAVFKRLMEKGLILIRGANPRILNKSFRNFVLTKVKPADIMKMAKKVRKESSWNQAKALITVSILALFAFFFYTQGELIDKTIALFTGLAAFVPLLREISSNFSMPETNLSNFFPKRWGREK